MESNRIFLIGCWNKNSCKDGSKIDNREFVLNNILRDSQEYDFGIMLGDNIYPSKKFQTKKNKKRGRKTKKYTKNDELYYRNFLELTDNITSKSLFDTKLHVILGNHDVFNKCVKRNQIRAFTTGISNIYEENTLVETDLANFAFLNSNNIPQMIEFLDGFDRKVLQDKWLIFCAHEPLISYKPKKKRIFQKLKNLKLLFDIIKNLKHNKVAYFCADTHNFQVLDILESDFKSNYSNSNQFSLPIIVAGTGGAKPDSLKNIEENMVYYEEKEELHVSVIDYKECYGYLDLNITKDELDIKYKRCETENQVRIKFHTRNNILSYKTNEKERICDKKILPKCPLSTSIETEISCI